MTGLVEDRKSQFRYKEDEAKRICASLARDDIPEKDEGDIPFEGFNRGSIVKRLERVASEYINREHEVARLEACLEAWSTIVECAPRLANAYNIVNSDKGDGSDEWFFLPEVLRRLEITATYKMRRIRDDIDPSHPLMARRWAGGAAAVRKGDAERLEYYSSVLAVWTAMGGELRTSKSSEPPYDVNGPLVRFFSAVVDPVMGASAPRIKSIPAIVRREKERLAKDSDARMLMLERARRELP